MQAKASAIPNVYYTPSGPTPISTENLPAALLLTPSPIAYESSETSRLSERLADPDKFDGDRNKLLNFIDDIRLKFAINGDRYPTARERKAYVVSRLTGLAYQQVRPYIRLGVPQVADFEQILEILEKAFGDPNRASRAS